MNRWTVSTRVAEARGAEDDDNGNEVDEVGRDGMEELPELWTDSEGLETILSVATKELEDDS